MFRKLSAFALVVFSMPEIRKIRQSLIGQVAKIFTKLLRKIRQSLRGQSFQIEMSLVLL